MSIINAIQAGDWNEVIKALDADPMLLEEVTGFHEATTPLVYAAAAGELEVVRVLIEKGANILATTVNSGKTALHYAADNGDDEMVAYLLDRGAQPGQHGSDGFTVYMYAAMNNHASVVRLLLEHTEVNGLDATDNYCRRTALHWAAQKGHGEVVAALLRHGARADTRDRAGISPLRTAVYHGRLEILGLLVDHMGTQALLQERDRNGRSLLHIAIRQKQEDIVPCLLSKGLLPNLRDNHGETALMYAAQGISAGPDMRIMKTLLKHMDGQGLDERNNVGWTALHIAANAGRPANVRALLLAGADPTIVDSQGRAPRAVDAKRCKNQCAAAFTVSTNAWYPCLHMMYI